MQTRFHFSLQANRGQARAGVVQTAHGAVSTPTFMPVGTLGTVKSLDTQDVLDTQAPIILGNTYHLYLRPGLAPIVQAGGLHRWMSWNKPMLTDSGGFQVWSLGQGNTAALLSKVSDDGVAFTSHIDGSQHFFTPEKSIEIQRQLGADIIMAFDDCTPDEANPLVAASSLERTFTWTKRCVSYWEAAQRQSVHGWYQALFGIVQGSTYPELRRLGTQQMTSLPVDGIAFGGETVGYNMAQTREILDWVAPVLPEQLPRYAMGLGRDPQDILDAVQAGFDMFDCVAPTRLARNGTLYFGVVEEVAGTVQFISPYKNGRLQIGNAEFRSDFGVIQDSCDCYTCKQGYTRSYLHHLFRTQELTYYRLASIHNVRTMVRLSEIMREWILQG